MSQTNPHGTLPLFAPYDASKFRSPLMPPPMTAEGVTGRVVRIEDSVVTVQWSPTEKGEAGAEDAHQHARDHAPGWLLEALGDALQAQHGREFTSEQIREAAGPTVNAWLDVKGRGNCFPGWWRARRKQFKLVRVNRPPAVAQRASRRGSTLPYWKFPESNPCL